MFKISNGGVISFFNWTKDERPKVYLFLQNNSKPAVNSWQCETVWVGNEAVELSLKEFSQMWSHPDRVQTSSKRFV